MDELITLLARNPIFYSLTDQQRARMAKLAQRRRYQAGEIIAHHGDIWPYMFLVGNGRVRAIKESIEGRRLMVTSLSPGEILWGMAFFIEGAPLPVLLTAQEDCLLHLWHREQLVPLLMESGRSLWQLACLMVDRMQRASDLVDGLAFQSVTRRVAQMVLDLFQGQEGQSVARDMTLDEMAAAVGTTREVVCRTLYRLAEHEMIEITRTEFLLTDQQALTGIARGD